MKSLILLLSIFFNFVVVANSGENEEPVVAISNAEMLINRDTQYNLKLNKVLDNRCNFMVFENKNNSQFAVLQVSKSDIEHTDFFKGSRNSYVAKNADKYRYKNIFETPTRGHIFRLENNNLIVKYERIEENGLYTSKEMTLLKGLNCK